MPGRVPRAAA